MEGLLILQIVNLLWIALMPLLATVGAACLSDFVRTLRLGRVGSICCWCPALAPLEDQELLV
jgi:hypothetical protein